MTGEKPVSSFDFVPIDTTNPETKPFTKHFCSNATSRVEDISIIDESEQSFLIFQDQYTNHHKPIKNLASSSIKQYQKPNDKGYKYFEISELLKKYKITGAIFGK
jgi:hypothetical protein